MNEVCVSINGAFLFIFLYDYEDSTELLYILGWIPIVFIFI
jgi:hypothetical protein